MVPSRSAMLRRLMTPTLRMAAPSKAASVRALHTPLASRPAASVLMPKLSPVVRGLHSSRSALADAPAVNKGSTFGKYKTSNVHVLESPAVTTWQEIPRGGINRGKGAFVKVRHNFRHSEQLARQTRPHWCWSPSPSALHTAHCPADEPHVASLPSRFGTTTLSCPSTWCASLRQASAAGSSTSAYPPCVPRPARPSAHPLWPACQTATTPRYFSVNVEIAWNKNMRGTYDHTGMSDYRSEKHSERLLYPGMRNRNKEPVKMFPFNFIPMQRARLPIRRPPTG